MCHTHLSFITQRRKRKRSHWLRKPRSCERLFPGAVPRTEISLYPIFQAAVCLSMSLAGWRRSQSVFTKVSRNGLSTCKPSCQLFKNRLLPSFLTCFGAQKALAPPSKEFLANKEGRERGPGRQNRSKGCLFGVLGGHFNGMHLKPRVLGSSASSGNACTLILSRSFTFRASGFYSEKWKK